MNLKKRKIGIPMKSKRRNLRDVDLEQQLVIQVGEKMIVHSIEVSGHLVMMLDEQEAKTMRTQTRI